MENSALIAEPSHDAGANAGARQLVGLHRYALLAALLIVFTGMVALVAPTDPDVWWHLRNGQLVLESGVPSADVYSFTAQGRTWIQQEWLTEVGMHVVKGALGYAALSWLFGLLQALGGYIAYTLMRRLGAGRLLSLLLLMVYAVLAAPTWGVRPQVLTPVFSGLFFLVLIEFRANRGRRRWLFSLPLLMALWTNLHASYFIGLLVLGAFVVGEWANSRTGGTAAPTPMRPLVLTLGACVLATLANPYFLRLWTYPLSYITSGTGSPLLRYTQEWQSPNFHEPGPLVFGLTLVLFAVVGLARSAGRGVDLEEVPEQRTGPDWSLALVVAGFTLLALQAGRLLPLYGVMALPVLGAILARKWPTLSARRDKPAVAVEAGLNYQALVAGVLVIGYFFLTAPNAQTGVEPRTETAFVYPVEGAKYIASLNRPVRMFNEFAWGGYLIYTLFPRTQVFIDGRADMYREGVFEDYMRVQGVGPGWRETIDRYAVDTALVPSGSAIAYALSREAGWKATHTDSVAVVFERESR